MEIFKKYRFEAAHRFPYVGGDHKCAGLHGHSYRVEIHVSGDVDPKMGWIIDFADITEAFDPIRRELDHKFLNDIEGLENPTTEKIARWIWERMEGRLPGLSKVVVHETETGGAIYCGR